MILLELGAGTGNFPRKILSNINQPLRYLATEPSEGFLKSFRQLCPDVEVEQYIAADIPLLDQCAQNSVCSTSFHWFANNERLDEM